MVKQAIMRHLKGQELADLLMAYIYGGARDKPESERRAEVDRRIQEASIDANDDYIMVRGEGEEACRWVDTLIQMDNQKGIANKRNAELLNAVAVQRSQDAMELRNAQREEEEIRHADSESAADSSASEDETSTTADSSASEDETSTTADVDPGDEPSPAPSVKPRKRRP